MKEVSVIIPVYNGEKYLGKCLEALLSQEYPSSLYEVIVVDNGSTDSTLKIASKYPVEILEEKSVKSSYAARNKGIAASSGSIIAFTDADCIPDKNWLAEGLSVMNEAAVDMAGGRVEFFYPAGGTSAEILDSLTNMRNDRDIRERKVAKTANLFVRKTVFGQAGLFMGDQVSGGDVEWTKRATAMGFTIRYAPEAFVMHPARSWKALLKKQMRVGRGKRCIWEREKRPFLWRLSFTLHAFFPLRVSTVRRLVGDAGLKDKGLRYSLFGIWTAGCIASIFTGLGILLSCLPFGGKK